MSRRIKIFIAIAVFASAAMVVVGCMIVLIQKAGRAAAAEEHRHVVSGLIERCNRLMEEWHLEAASLDLVEAKKVHSSSVFAEADLEAKLSEIEQRLEKLKGERAKKLAAGYKMHEGVFRSPDEIKKRDDAKRRKKAEEDRLAIDNQRRIDQAQREEIELANKIRAAKEPSNHQVGALRYGVRESWWADEISAGVLRSWRPDHKFLCIRLEVENTGKKPESPNKPMLLDETDAEYVSVTLPGWEEAFKAGIFENMNPRDFASGVVVFDVRTDRKYQLILKGNLFSNNDSIAPLKFLPEKK